MALGGAWSDLVARDAAAPCVAGVAQTHIYHRFSKQAWHKLTSTIVWRGRRGTDGTGWRAWSDLVARDAAALCVAGAAQCHIDVRFAWQAWHKLTSTVVWRGRRGTDGQVLALRNLSPHHPMMFAAWVAPAYRINDIVSQVRFQVRFLLFAHVL